MLSTVWVLDRHCLCCLEKNFNLIITQTKFVSLDVRSTDSSRFFFFDAHVDEIHKAHDCHPSIRCPVQRDLLAQFISDANWSESAPSVVELQLSKRKQRTKRDLPRKSLWITPMSFHHGHRWISLGPRPSSLLESIIRTSYHWSKQQTTFTRRSPSHGRQITKSACEELSPIHWPSYANFHSTFLVVRGLRRCRQCRGLPRKSHVGMRREGVHWLLREELFGWR